MPQWTLCVRSWDAERPGCIPTQSLGIHYNESNDLLDYVKDPRVFDYDKGFVKIPNGPGLSLIHI